MRYLKSPMRVASKKVATSKNTVTGDSFTERTRLVPTPEGLVLHFNIKQGSVAKEGAGWYLKDLSNSKRHLTVKNAPVVNSDYLSFDGVNDYLSADSGGLVPMPAGNSPRTIIGLITNRGGGYRHIIHYGSSTTNQAYGLNHTIIGTGFIGTHTWAGCAAPGESSAINKLSFHAIMYDPLDYHTGYQNGVYYDSNNMRFGQGKTVQYEIDTGTVYDVHVGSRIQPLAELFVGDLYTISVYNRVLSVRELDHIYKTYKDYYGITN